MKALVATRDGQGIRGNDFCFTIEGELVTFGFECDREEIDGSCGCRRAMVGVNSHKATTTMKVVEVPHTPMEIASLTLKSKKEAGFSIAGASELMYMEMVIDLCKIVEIYPIGAILERRGEEFIQRI